MLCTDDNPSHIRGLCRAHYAKFLRAKSHVDPGELEAWEKLAIADGQIMESGGKTRNSDNPFLETLAKLRAEKGVRTVSAEEEAEADARAEADEQAIKDGPVVPESKPKKKAQPKPIEESEEVSRKRKSG